MSTTTLVNDVIRYIFEGLNPGEIINYCSTSEYNTNLCKQSEFSNYFLNRFFSGNLSSIKNLIPSNEILPLSYLIYDMKPSEAFNISNNDLVRKGIILYQIGNYPLILNMNSDVIVAIFNNLYPINIVSTLNNFNNYGEVYRTRDLLNRAFSLCYSQNDMIKLLDTISEYYIKQDLGYLYYLSLFYAREDVYNYVKAKYPIKLNNENNKYGPKIMNTISLTFEIGSETELYANYLLYTDDYVSSFEIEDYNFSIYLLEYSNYPKLLFDKYKDRFLLDADFRKAYNGNINNGYFIAYMMNDNIDMNVIKQVNKDNVRETASNLVLSLLNPDIINWLYDIDEGYLDIDTLARSIRKLPIDIVWKLLPIITNGKKEENINALYTSILNNTYNISINIYTVILYRLTLSTSKTSMLEEYTKYITKYIK
ncbi:Hypothetical protein ORPV_253 [Orpheovirus IHUMI-LCC2]|uniref:Uncharacterized protein n=1 Tax=Orpheovirus IHUMI-LCC2 TaxID=2023057 RepID=A0A2I2L3S1_9VIRU|nr:Hypothetical protein ORPV_253 [Orpheovirus IHUMI-LCC2]SNW62157.1 Hypothetical protein ORPV_253 [Orpheovirus IHUMI-LCC2]